MHVIRATIIVFPLQLQNLNLKGKTTGILAFVVKGHLHENGWLFSPQDFVLWAKTRGGIIEVPA